LKRGKAPSTCSSLSFFTSRLLRTHFAKVIQSSVIQTK
jgi:hypothetical protein